ncbi:MAG: CHAT domain-containing protein [Bacteroidota bacterium]
MKIFSLGVISQLAARSGLLQYVILSRPLGDYAQAEYFHELALKISLQSLGKSHSEYPMIISELGRTAQLSGDLSKADSLLNFSLQARKDILGKKHPFYSAGLMDLAALYLEKNLPDAAYLLLSEALNIQMENEGPGHSSVAATLQKIAYCRLLQGRYQEADSLMLVSGNLFQTIYGDDGQTIARSRDNRMLTRMSLYPDDGQILVWAKQGHEIWKNTARRAISNASPNQLESLLFSLSFHYNIVNTVSALQNDAGLAYDNALLFKNLALQSRARWLRETNVQKDAASMANFRRWQQIQRRLNNELNKPRPQRQQVDSLEYILQQTERNFAAFTGPDDNIIPDWHTVQDSLNNREAAVEFIHYTIPKPLSDGNTTHYAALVLLSGEASPRFVPLFEEGKLSALLERQTGSAESVAALYTRSGHLLDDNPQYGKELYELVWKPVGQFLPGRVRTVYVSLSGLLHRVNITALPVGKNRVVADRYVIRQTGSTRSIVLGKPDSRETNPTAMLLGGIQYQSDSTEPGSDGFAFQAGDYVRGMSGLALTENRDTGIIWDYLEGTEQEVVRCARLLGKAGFQTELYKGLSATEERVKKTGSGEERSPDVLHLATHGYFFRAPASTGGSATNNFAAHQHPLFRSGLLLAGADYAWRTGKSCGNREDGILTAYEISHLNLSDTRLAVLSACQTGLGDIKGSEGVFGLQRAFKMAGVDYLLVSLWQVPDQETADFMEAFYDAWTGGNTVHSAFAKAQKQMRIKYKEVYRWGAWVLVE